MKGICYLTIGMALGAGIALMTNKNAECQKLMKKINIK